MSTSVNPAWAISCLNKSHSVFNLNCEGIELNWLKTLKMMLLYGWNFLSNSARSHWLLRGHMTSHNETVSLQNLRAGSSVKSMTSQGNSAVLPANVDRRPPLQQGLMNFQLQNFQQYNKSLKDGSLGNKINCFPRDQSLSVYCLNDTVTYLRLPIQTNVHSVTQRFGFIN